MKPLTRREHEILQLVAHGHTYQQIAARLYISEKTVHGHLHNTKQKLGANTRSHAIHLAHQHGLLDNN